MNTTDKASIASDIDVDALEAMNVQERHEKLAELYSNFKKVEYDLTPREYQIFKAFSVMKDENTWLWEEYEEAYNHKETAHEALDQLEDAQEKIGDLKAQIEDVKDLRAKSREMDEKIAELKSEVYELYGMERLQGEDEKRAGKKRAPRWARPSTRKP